MRALELRVPPLAVVAVTAAAMFGLARLVPAAGLELPGRGSAALILLVLGLATAVAGVLAFRANATTVDPRTPGQASTVVVSGVYRFSRNPMYLGFLCVLAAWAVHLGNLMSLMLLPAFVAYINVFQIVPEERILLARFGPRFAQYMATVRRWI